MPPGAAGETAYPDRISTPTNIDCFDRLLVALSSGQTTEQP